MNAMWTLVRTLCLVVSCAVIGTLAACSKNPSTEDGGNGGAENASAGGGDVGADAGDDANEPIDPAMFGQVKSMIQLQVDGMAVQSQTLRTAATEHPDQKLNDLVKQLEDKNAEIKKIMEQATSPAQSRLLKVDIPKKMGEAGELASKASARLMEVLQAGAPSGG